MTGSKFVSLFVALILVTAACSSPQSTAQMWASESSTGSTFEVLRERCIDHLSGIVATNIRHDVNPTGRGAFIFDDTESVLTDLAGWHESCSTLRDEWPGEAEDSPLLLLLEGTEEPSSVLELETDPLLALRDAAETLDTTGTIASLLLYDSIARLLEAGGDASLRSDSGLAPRLLFGDQFVNAGALHGPTTVELLAAEIPELRVEDLGSPPQLELVMVAMSRFVVADLHRLARCSPRGEVHAALVDFLGLLLRHEQAETGGALSLAYFERNLDFFLSRCGESGQPAR